MEADGLLLVGGGKGKGKGLDGPAPEEDDDTEAETSEEELAAAGALARALGVKGADAAKVASALRTWKEACESGYLSDSDEDA